MQSKVRTLLLKGIRELSHTAPHPRRSTDWAAAAAIAIAIADDDDHVAGDDYYFFLMRNIN